MTCFYFFLFFPFFAYVSNPFNVRWRWCHCLLLSQTENIGLPVCLFTFIALRSQVGDHWRWEMSSVPHWTFQPLSVHHHTVNLSMWTHLHTQHSLSKEVLEFNLEEHQGDQSHMLQDCMFMFSVTKTCRDTLCHSETDHHFRWLWWRETIYQALIISFDHKLWVVTKGIKLLIQSDIMTPPQNCWLQSMQ